MLRVGIDTGGTFTDIVVADGGGLTSFKIASTPGDPAAAILEALDRVSNAGLSIEVVHGTTVGTNALLERRGALTALVTTAGFEDVLAIGRQARRELYSLRPVAPPPLVPAERRLGVHERVGADGTVLRRIEATELAEIVEALRQAKVESVAVCLLFSFANPAHEQEIETAVAELGVPVSLSSRILPEYREYERTATVTVNAYLAPVMASYLGQVATAGCERGVERLRVMQSSGGCIGAATAAAEPVRTILSGPAGGVVAAARLGAIACLGDLLTFDMGGTSTDVSLLASGNILTRSDATVAEMPVAVPVIDIHTVGAGGGSIAFVDDGGALRVGPRSAGADPGPSCYGRGGPATVTDANVVLGRLDRLLGGGLGLDRGQARASLEALARKMSSGGAVPVEQAALGVLRVAVANMERALRVVSIERGFDPRKAALLAFGGAGGLHACDIAESLEMTRVVVPPLPGAFSAFGVLAGDVVRDFSRTFLRTLPLSPADRGEVEALFADLEGEARSALRDEGVRDTDASVRRTVGLRYRGQSFDLDVEWSDDSAPEFHRAHRSRYGHADEARQVELVHLRVRACGRVPEPPLPSLSRREGEAVARDVAEVHFAGGWRVIPVYVREGLQAGEYAQGPALVKEYGSTTLVNPGWKFVVDEFGCLRLSR